MPGWSGWRQANGPSPSERASSAACSSRPPWPNSSARRSGRLSAQNLLALVRKELIRPERSDLTAGDAFKFRHILIRDAAYKALPKSERAILHERFADWFERTVGERLAEYEEIVGYHLEAAHRYRSEVGETGDHLAALAARAGAHLAMAGSRALDRGDMATAAILLGRATRAYPAASPERLRLIPDLSYALFSTGRRTEADRLLTAAADEATTAGETLLAIAIDLERALTTILTDGMPRAARETAEAAIPVLERESDDLGLARAYLVLRDRCVDERADRGGDRS